MATIKSGSSSDLMDINANKAGKVELTDQSGLPLGVSEALTPPATLYGIPGFGANDGRPVPFRADRLGGQAIAWHTPLMSESFEGTVINPLRWLIIATTMAATQSTVAGLTLNSGAITTINTGYMIKSTRLFQKTQRAPLQSKKRVRLAHVNNSVMEFGYGDAATFNGAHTAGAYWQKNSIGELRPVITYNGVDSTGPNFAGFVDNDKYYTTDVILDDDSATFFIQRTDTEVIVAKHTMQLPVTAQRLLSSTQIAVFARLYNTGVAPATAPQMFITDVYVAMLDANLNAPLAHLQSLQHRSLLENPFTGVQLSQFTNSAAPANATLSNAAAGYAVLDGLFSFAAVAGAATDYALFGVQVPSPATFVITDISIETWNTGAIVATTPTLLSWAIATQLTAVSLATAAHTRKFIGTQSLPVGAAIGANAQRIDKQFQTPIICSPGRFTVIILRMPVGTATASQVIQGGVAVGGYSI